MKQATVFIQAEKTIPIRNNEKLIKNYSGIPFPLTIALLILIGCTKPGIDDGPGATLARVTIVSANTINQTTAQSGGNITSDGDSPITARGVCWSRLRQWVCLPIQMRQT